MLAHCGINCSECPTLLATKANDDMKRAKVAEAWSKQFGWNLTVEDMNCDGCRGGGVLFKFCQECQIRSCCEEKGFDNCAPCPDFGCEKVRIIWKFFPDGKDNLDQLRQSN